MKTDGNNKNLDELISRAISREAPKFDFDKWQKTHKKEIEIFKSQTTKQEKHSVRIFKIGRIIMKSKITKFAAAAVIVVSTAIAFHIFVADGTSNAFGQMTENMKKVSWMHAVVEGVYSGKPDRLEAWISFESQKYIDKKANGKVTYWHKRTKQLYDPDSDTITISYDSDDALGSIGSIWDYWKNIMEMVNVAEGKIIEDSCKYEGKDAKVYKIEIPSSPLGTPMELKIIENTETNLPVFLNQKAFGPDGQVTVEANGYFDYPKNGPADIYEAGVLKTAKVINELPTESVTKIMEEYKSHRESAPSVYIALVTDSLFDEKLNTFLTYGMSVIYRNDKTQRIDDFRLPQTNQKEWRENWLKFTKEMGISFELLLAWWKQNGELINVNLFDGRFQYEARLENQNWAREPKRYSPTGDDYRADNDLADFGWGVHFLSRYSGAGPFTIVETEYSKEHNVICLETLAQGRIETDSKQEVWAIPPKRVRSYLNPERDYICQRYEEEESFEATWQNDETLIESIEKDNIKKNSINNQIREVVEFGQTEDGKWYPKTIKSWDPTDTNNVRIKKIYLRTNPEFPVGIFDPNNLPK